MGDEKPPPDEEKKGDWETIGYAPRIYETYPCEHRWKLAHPKGPCPTYKNIRYIVLPLSDRMKQLAQPLLRRLLALWLEFGDKFPPEMRARLLGFLTDNYGISADLLENMLETKRAEEEKQRLEKEKAGKKGKKGKKGKGKKRRKNKKGKKGKGKDGKKGKKGKHKKQKSKKEKKVKEKVVKEKGEKVKKPKEDKLAFKKRKAGKLPLDWPYNMGSKFLLKCIAYLSQDPDEDYSSRASEYFDVQAMAILEFVCNYLDMPLPDPDRPSQYGETLVIMALNLTHWIAKFVTTPAQSIPDDKVEEYLGLKGIRPKPPKPQKPAKEDQKKDKKKKIPPPPEPVTEIQRNWDESKSPVYVPKKIRISKRKRYDDEEDEECDLKNGCAFEEGEPIDLEIEEEVGVPRWKDYTLDEVIKEFLEYINWYNPWEPEFMYSGPRKTPEGIQIFNIWDPDSNDVPNDLRVLNWTWPENQKFSDKYSFIPSPVPLYYPTLRPLRPIRLEDLERSGIPRDIIKHDIRFFSPWYLISKSLKPVTPKSTPTPSETGSKQYEGEGEGDRETDVKDEVFDDEMLKTKVPCIQDSLWGDNKMREQIEIIGHLLHLVSSVPELTIEHVFEILEEFVESVKCAELDENPTDENKLLIKKRTILLERYFVDFFGVKFRDYNPRVYGYVRALCTRCAYYIQLLYEHTARILWELQNRPNMPTPIPTPPPTPDDPQALQDWDEWLAWLLMVTETCEDWAQWITETVDEAEKKAAKQKGEFIGPDGKIERLTRNEWFAWKSSIEDDVYRYRSAKRSITKQSPYYLEKAKTIQRVKHRPVKIPEEDLGDEEEYKEDMEEEEQQTEETEQESFVLDDKKQEIEELQSSEEVVEPAPEPEPNADIENDAEFQDTTEPEEGEEEP